MSDSPAPTPSAPAPKPPAPSGPPTWRDVWQLPVLGLGATLLVGGMVALIMSRPSEDLAPTITRAERLIGDGQYVPAIQTLNEDVYPRLEKDLLTPDQKRRYYTLLSRAIFLGAREKQIARPENYQSVIDGYLEAERLHAQLVPEDVEYFASANIALDRLPLAAQRADSLPNAEDERRRRLLRAIVTRALALPQPDLGLAADLVGKFLADPRLPDNDRLWAVLRQTELRLAEGQNDVAIRGILQQLQRVGPGHEAEVGELNLLLARGYVAEASRVDDQGRPPADAPDLRDQAARALERAKAQLSAHSGGAFDAEIEYRIGELAAARGDTRAARDSFAAVVNSAAERPWKMRAYLGLGESAAAQGDSDESLGAYEQLVESMAAGSPPAGLTKDLVSASIVSRYRERFDSNDTATALRFADLGEKLWTPPKANADVLMALAEGNKRAAEEAIAAAVDQHGAVITLAELDPATRKQVRELMIRSATAYRNHATRVVLDDTSAYAESVWQSADMFDRAGDQDQAITMFQQYANDFPSDARNAEASFRLASAYQARGDYELAAERYRKLIEERGRGTGGSSVFADRAYVPLARTLLADTDAANDAEAERYLTAVVGGQIAESDSVVFRDALFELGRYYARTGAHEQAIERLEEALDRFPDDPEVHAARFRLADAYRLSAGALAKRLGEAMPDVDRQKLETLRSDRLNKSLGLYEQTRRALEALPPGRRTALDDLYLRNSYFYLGDCAFDLGQYDTAVRHYTAARDRYPTDPASLVAMIQIVNANLAAGQYDAALTANERARRFYKSLPEEVWDDPNLPMARKDWERWLDSTDQLARQAQAQREDHAGAAMPDPE